MQARLYHDPFLDPPHFGPLGPTPFRDSRWTFPFLGFAADCLGEASQQL